MAVKTLTTDNVGGRPAECMASTGDGWMEAKSNYAPGRRQVRCSMWVGRLAGAEVCLLPGYEGFRIAQIREGRIGILRGISCWWSMGMFVCGVSVVIFWCG